MDKRDSWLDTAVSGIRFGPDREAVRRELAEHIEDRAADLVRIFPDIPEKEAQERALAAMGDAWEVKKELARVHRPWLGWLWKASQWAVWLGLIALNLIVLGTQTGYENSLWGRSSLEVYCRIQNGEEARLGQYTFRITGAACLDRPEGTEAVDTLQVVLRASTPRFWERINVDALLNSLYVTGPDGQRRCMGWMLPQDYTTVDELGNVTGRSRLWVNGGGLCRWGLGWTEVALSIPAEGWQPRDVVTVELDSPAGGAILSVPVTEKVGIP